MNNKFILTTIAFSLLVLSVFTSCGDDNEYKEVAVTAVKALYDPVDERHVDLQLAGSLFFEWEKATAADNGVVYYDVLFDLPGGDFSEPIYTVVADNRGINSSVNMTHRTLNKVARYAGAEPGEMAAFIWTVRSNRGLSFEVSDQKRLMTVIRLPGIDEPEGDLVIMGVGTEEGHKLKRLTGDAEIYELYTKIEANTPFYFYNKLGNGDERFFTIENEGTGFVETKEKPEGFMVDKTGIYQVTVNFDERKASIATIGRVYLQHCWLGYQREFSYVEKGMWEYINFAVQIEPDERYKFMIETNGEIITWGQIKADDGQPGLSNISHFQMEPKGVVNNQWGLLPFKFPKEVADKTLGGGTHFMCDMYLYLNTEGDEYYHYFENIQEMK